MARFLATLVSATLMWASFPPLDLGFLIFVAPVPFLWALRRVGTPREAGWLGFTFGFIFFGAMLSWSFVMGAVAFLPLTTVMALWSTGYALLMYLARNWSPTRWWSMAVGAWALWEFLKARIPFGGFPWGSAGYPIGTIPGMRGSAQWIGPTGWGVVVIAVAAGIVLMLEEERDRRMFEVAISVVAVLTVLGGILSPSAEGYQVRVALVQGNSPCPRVGCPDEKQQIFNSHLNLTRTIEVRSVDLVVWAEDSFGGSYNPTFNSEVAAQMATEARRLGAYLIAGGTRPAGPGMFDNVNILFAPDGSIVGEYQKRHPVPFGEYVPFRDLLEFIPQLDEVPNDMTRGEGPVVFPIEVEEGPGVFGSVISFEGVFPRYMRATVNAGARLIVVATNNGSYGRGAASDQQIGLVRMNAASFGVDVVHVAVTGKSTFIGAGGSTAGRSEQFESVVLRGTVRFQDAPRTLYALAGDWLQVLAILNALVLVAAYREARRGFKIRPEVRR